MDESRLIVWVFAGLFIVCCVYAVIVHHLRSWYIRENKTWFMLVVGVCLVLAALAIFIPFGVIQLREWGLMVLAFCVGGAPMVVGQLIQDAHDRALHQTRRNHDENSRR